MKYMVHACSDIELTTLTTGQGCVLHSTYSSAVPLQSDPPWAASVHSLYLYVRPPAQVTLQPVQLDQSDHWPSTTSINSPNSLNNKQETCSARQAQCLELHTPFRFHLNVLMVKLFQVLNRGRENICWNRWHICHNFSNMVGTPNAWRHLLWEIELSNNHMSLHYNTKSTCTVSTWGTRMGRLVHTAQSNPIRPFKIHTKWYYTSQRFKSVVWHRVLMLAGFPTKLCSFAA